MKVNVIGFEISEGTSKKTGNAYAIGKLYAALPLAAAKGAKGYMGSEYRAEPAVLRKIEHIQPPLMCEVEFQDVMRFGERKQEIVSIVPISLDTVAGRSAPPAAAAGPAAAAR